jgi:plasmid maintenance system antidote protein VapI
VPAEELAELAAGQRDMTPDMAMRVETRFRVRADLLLRIQLLYQTHAMRRCARPGVKRHASAA